MERGKRGQITVFVIIAIIVVAVAGGTFVVINNQKQKATDKFFSQPSLKPTVDNIRDSLVECMDQTTQEGLVVIGIQGGYNNPPNDIFDLGWAFIPYYYDQGSFLKPTTGEIESELSSYVNEEIDNCIDKFNFEGFQVSNSLISTKTEIGPGSVKFEINSDVGIEREGNTLKVSLGDNPISQPSLLFEMLEIADYITDSHKDDPDFICINCVADLAQERDVFVDMLDFGDDTTLVVISENRTTSEPYIFEFLNRYPPGDVEVPSAP